MIVALSAGILVFVSLRYLLRPGTAQNLSSADIGFTVRKRGDGFEVTVSNLSYSDAARVALLITELNKRAVKPPCQIIPFPKETTR